MFRNRFLLLFGGCLLAASAALADDVGFVDCSNHPDDIQVFGKPRRTPDIIASVPCGTRFTVLVYGFVFSRIQTGDGKVGYVYSNLIAIDRTATAAQQNGSVRMATDKSIVPSSTPPVVKPFAVAQPQPQAPAAPAAAPVSAQPLPAPAATVAVQAPAVAPPVFTAPVAASPAPLSNTPESAATPAQPTPSTPAQPQPSPASPAPAQPQPALAPPAPAPAPPQPQPSTAPPSSTPAPTPAMAASSMPEKSATVVAQPDSAAATQPEPSTAPAPPEAPAPAVRSGNDRTSWEKPNPGLRRRAPLLEFFGGYAFARMAGAAGTATNLSGGMGSVGWNIKPWLQILGDSSYSVVTASGAKNVLYGNHFGPRYFHRGHNRWGLTPFVEALVGG